MKREFLVDGVRCICYGSSEPSCVLIQGEDSSRLDELDSEVRILEKLTDRPFLLVAFAVENWNRDLSPWRAPAVFGNDDFGDGAQKTLDFVGNALIPIFLIPSA